jgi:hypothetical protein
MKTFWIGMMVAAFVLGTPIVGIIYVLGKMGFSFLESESYIALKVRIFANTGSAMAIRQ